MTEPTYNQLHRLLKDDDDRRHGREPKRHHTVAAYQVSGPVDDGALHEAWLAVQQDYPVLRTRFERSEAGWRWLTDELTPPAGLRRDRAADLAGAHQLAQQWADRRFDLAAEPLARLVLIEVDDDTRVLVLVAEHLVCDGWSTLCLVGRLSEIYAELCGRGTRSPLDCESYLDQARYEQAQIAALDVEDVARLHEQVLPALPVPQPAEVDHLRCATVRLSYDRARLAAAARRELGPFGASALVHAAAQHGLAAAFPPGPPATLLTMAIRHRRPARAAVGWYVNKVPVATVPAGGPALESPAAFGHRLAKALDRHPVPWTWLLATARPEAFGRHASCPYAGFNAMAEVSRRVARAATERPIGRLRKLGIDTGFWDAALMVSVDSTDTEVAVLVEAKQDFVPSPALAGFADRLDAALRSWIGPLASAAGPAGAAENGRSAHGG
ncbi:condensation domain-containing protein [Jatrophihabitans sp.]|uniref:condensation domain-containing protein n=1 Tax=Jatrophihabitans sp. TaxID=1932789 RepID=UPI002D1AD073|nr:condensation domain-containing protein [Jatrophihabitans sp.]